MSFWRIVWQSLKFNRKINLAVALGVAAATAVLTGALLVGSSMRGSLRALTLERLNRVDEVLVTRTFFNASLVEQLRATPTFQDHYQQVAGSIYFPAASLETAESLPTGDGISVPLRRAGEVQILAGDSDLWWFGGADRSSQKSPGEGEIILNRALASSLGITQEEVAAGDVLVTLRLPKQHAVPSDSPLGEKEDLILNLPRLKVIEILDDTGLGRFGMHPTQLTPLNAFVSLRQVQSALEKPDQLNCLWVGKEDSSHPPAREVSDELNTALKPSFEDYGLLLKHVIQDQPDGQAVFDYYSISSSEMVLSDPLAKTVTEALQGLDPQPVLTYLANDLDVVRPESPPDGKSGTPYSMVSAIEFGDSFAPLSAISGEPITTIAADEIVLNEWAAHDCGAEVGDLIRVTYFEPETAHGQTTEVSHDFRLKDIAKLTEPSRPYSRSRVAEFDQMPTLANDPDLTPEVPGVTDQESIENWDLPFSTAERIQREDDLYWQYYRTTPKGFVSLEAGQTIWQSRFGKVTSLRIAAEQATESEIRERIINALHASQEPFGFEFASLKREGLKGAGGTTPFDGLFLGLSLFIIVAALMLVVLLFKLGLEQRANEAGLLLATGFYKRRVAWLFGCEGLLVAAIGGLLGVAIGIGYAALMVYGLKTWWVGAIRTPFIDLYVDGPTLTLGYLVSLLVCGLTIAVIVLRFRPGSVRTLLSGKLESSTGRVSGASKLWAYGGLGTLLLAITAAVATSLAPLSGESQAGAFMGSGALLLASLLILVWFGFRQSARQGSSLLDLWRLSFRNASRNSTRSTLTIGLVAAASFLVGSISAFRMQPSEAGTAGFDLLMTTSRPIFVDFNDSTDLSNRLGDLSQEVADLETLAFRMRRGDDASCNNPYQVSQPRVLGVDERVIQWFDDPEHTAFAFAGVLSDDPQVQKNPWRVLAETDGDTGVVPVVLDKNTAMWSLKVYSLGQEFQIEYDGVGPVTFKAVGFLSNSVLQGSLLIGDEDFRRLFPDISGNQYFLANSQAEPGSQQQDRVRGILETRLGDEGLTTQRTDQILAGLLAVQNTYLTTFQSLGALGLLLGTFGLATVQLRNVLERRGELGLMRALGFRRQRLGSLVMLENSLLLLGGLGIGTLAALFVVLPHLLLGDASVPWEALGWMLLAIVVVGLLTGLIAVRAALNLSVQQALRDE